MFSHLEWKWREIWFCSNCIKNVIETLILVYPNIFHAILWPSVFWCHVTAYKWVLCNILANFALSRGSYEPETLKMSMFIFYAHKNVE